MMVADKYIPRMRAPHQMHIICVDVTNKCDLDCSNCTRLLANQEELWEMTPENFRQALRSLKDYPGIIAMIGGNPCMHRNFEELCRIFVEEIPNRKQRGLWTNNHFKHRGIIDSTFGVYNLNSHGAPKASKELAILAQDARNRGDTVWNYYEHSDHSPLLTAMKDLYPDEEEMWEKITKCDINREWSASIVQINGVIRAYFCEVAASFDLARGGNNGLYPIEGWWKNSIHTYTSQILHFCPGCGVPAKQYAFKDFMDADIYTESNKDIATKNPKRTVFWLKPEDKIDHDRRTTQYSNLG